jgi:N-acetylated-alpha-linked acidic dipeptidase
VKTLPGIREAIEQKAWKEAQQGIAVVANVIHNYTVQVRQGLALLNKPAF